MKIQLNNYHRGKVLLKLPDEFKCPICGGPLYFKLHYRGIPMFGCENWNGGCSSPWRVTPNNMPWHCWFNYIEEFNVEENIKRNEQLYEMLGKLETKYPEMDRAIFEIVNKLIR